MPSQRFPRTARVRARRDFDRIFQQGRRVALPVMALHWQPTGTPDPSGLSTTSELPEQPMQARLGLAVSRKVDPHAVGRNRIKRVLRDCFRHHRAHLADGDYVIVARAGASRCTAEELRQALLGLLRRAGALPGPLPAVTMPAAVASTPPLPPEPASAPRVG